MSSISGAEVIVKVRKVLEERMMNKGISFNIDDISLFKNTTVLIEPSRYKGDDLDGMAIMYENGVYEVHEQQAGENNDELHILLETKSFKLALTNMLRGNKKRKPIKIWN